MEPVSVAAVASSLRRCAAGQVYLRAFFQSGASTESTWCNAADLDQNGDDGQVSGIFRVAWNSNSLLTCSPLSSSATPLMALRMWTPTCPLALPGSMSAKHI